MLKFSEKVKFIAMNKDGKFSWFGMLPVLHENFGFWSSNSCDYDAAYIPEIIDMSNCECADWTKSLYVVQSDLLINVSLDEVFEKGELMLYKLDPTYSWRPALFNRYIGDLKDIVEVSTLDMNFGVSEYCKFNEELLNLELYPEDQLAVKKYIQQTKE